MKPKPFPGAPLQGGHFFPIKIIQIGGEFLKGNQKSQIVGKTLKNLGIIMLSPKEYFDLYQGVLDYYKDLSDFWNKEIFQKAGGQIGSGKPVDYEVDCESEISKMIDGIDIQLLNMLFAMIQMTNDKSYLTMLNKGKNPDFLEQCEIFNMLLWTVYMSIFEKKYMYRTEILFDSISKIARKKLKFFMN